MTNTSDNRAVEMAADLIERAKASYPQAVEQDHSEPADHREDAFSTAVRVELGRAAEYRERGDSGKRLHFGVCGEWTVVIRTH